MTNSAICRIFFLLLVFFPALLSAKKIEMQTKSEAVYGFIEQIKVSLDSIPSRRTPEKKPEEKHHPGNKPDIKKPDAKKPDEKQRPNNKPDIKKTDPKKPDIKTVPQARRKPKPIVPGKGKIKPVKVPKSRVIKHPMAF